MNFRKSQIALAALAACGAMPLAAQAAPSIAWGTPANGAVLSDSVSGGACALLRSPVVVNDPTGSTYQATDLRAFVQANQ